jgi:hypothetical protein
MAKYFATLSLKNGSRVDVAAFGADDVCGQYYGGIS